MPETSIGQKFVTKRGYRGNEFALGTGGCRRHEKKNGENDAT